MQLLATGVVGATISWVLQIYILVLIARIVVDYVFMFARDWRPRIGHPRQGWRRNGSGSLSSRRIAQPSCLVRGLTLA